MAGARPSARLPFHPMSRHQINFPQPFPLSPHPLHHNHTGGSHYWGRKGMCYAPSQHLTSSSATACLSGWALGSVPTALAGAWLQRKNSSYSLTRCRGWKDIKFSQEGRTNGSKTKAADWEAARARAPPPQAHWSSQAALQPVSPPSACKSIEQK